MGAAALGAVVGTLTPVAVLTAESPWGERPTAEAAEAHGLLVHHVEGLGPDPLARWPELFTHLDVAVCCCWAEHLRPGALRAPASGWLNLHPSSLPAWRGADPVAWQLLTASAQIPCTVHRMTERSDDGPVVAEGSVAVQPGEDRGTLLRRAGGTLGLLAAEALAAVADGTELPERPQHAEQATWCPPHGTVAMVDPRAMSAAAGARVARAFSPQPGIAVTTMPPERRFAVPEPARRREASDPAGSVVYSEDGSVAVAFRDRWLLGRTWLLHADAATLSTVRDDTGR